jgi:ribosomal 50S subunit-recycling heat shock protein
LTNSPPMSTEPPNEENSQVFTVDKDAAGKRLDAFLSESIEGWSRARLQRLIEGGDVLVNAKAAKPSYKLREGDEIDVDLVEAPVERFVPENIPLDIVYEDEFLAVVNKPAGMVVHPGAGVSNGTLANAIAWHFQSVPPAVAGGSPQSPSAVDPTESDANIQPPATAGGTDMEPAFDRLSDNSAVLDFFNREFRDAVPLMHTLVEDFFHNPTGNLGTIKCFPWNAGGEALLLGDSAHAVVPFYGQGMNCAFEDVRVLDSLIGESGPDWEAVFTEYGRLRKPNTDAIADMAEENFYEMRDATADPVFQRKRELETKLEQTYPDYFSKYSMVTFREDLPYSVAKTRGNAQDQLLMGICAQTPDSSQIELPDVMEKIRSLKTN